MSVQSTLDILVSKLNDRSRTTENNFRLIENFIEANGLNIRKENEVLNELQRKICKAQVSDSLYVCFFFEVLLKNITLEFKRSTFYRNSN